VSRPRIRTLKPEMWADEKVGALTRDARLLFIGLITLADDAGRFRAMPSAILGHVFPYDLDALKKQESTLPAPPAWNGHGELIEDSVIVP
jgi:hypothetical protein